MQCLWRHHRRPRQHGGARRRRRDAHGGGDGAGRQLSGSGRLGGGENVEKMLGKSNISRAIVYRKSGYNIL